MPRSNRRLGPALALILAVAAQVSAAPAAVRSAFDPRSGSWDIRWPGRVSQYDLVYLSPPIDPLQGLPLGNGDVGVLFWCEDSRIIAVVNKSDLWDDAAFGRFHNWDKEEEDRSTTQRHACRIVFDFKNPIFSTLYLSDFKARLGLADATLALEARSPFGTVRLRAFVDHDTGVLFCDVGGDFAEDFPVDISVERYGSRTYSHWYSLINRDASIGLSGTDAGAADGCAWITQTVSDGTVAAGGSVLAADGATVAAASREHSRRSLISLGGGRSKSARLAFAVTSPVAPPADAVAALKRTLASARAAGPDTRLASHAAAWRAFWLRSLMDYGDDYFNRLWHLTMYYAKASQGGRYPGRFTNGLWGWDRDVQNWNFFFHWNQQQIYWPLNAAGHHDLVVPYLDYRFNSLPLARADARELLHADGAWIADVTDRRGYNSIPELDNHTPVAEIALEFWRQYKYTGDPAFLREKALPFILDAARFIASRLEKGPDGLYHAREATGYEGWIKLKDTISELVYARSVLGTALEALAAAKTNVPEAQAWREILRACAPLPAVPAGDLAIARDVSSARPTFKLKCGFFVGETVPTDAVFAAGWSVVDKRYVDFYVPAADGKFYGFNFYDGIFPTIHLAPVFPSGLIGLGEKGSRLFDVAVSSLRLYSPEVMGWDPTPIAMARLGLAPELARILDHWPERWQLYPNGWGHIGVEEPIKKDAEMFFRTNAVRDARSTVKDGPFPSDKSETFPLPVWPFRHMSMESMSVLAAAMNESLLQSHDGVIRIAPAVTKEKSARFTLHAEGGFVVTAEVEAGRPKWVAIESLAGNVCRLALPWPRAVVRSSLAKRPPWTIEGKRDAAGSVGVDAAAGGRSADAGTLEIKTRTGERFVLAPPGVDAAAWSVVAESPAPNEGVHARPSGKAQIGLPRMY